MLSTAAALPPELQEIAQALASLRGSETAEDPLTLSLSPRGERTPELPSADNSSVPLPLGRGTG